MDQRSMKGSKMSNMGKKAQLLKQHERKHYWCHNHQGNDFIASALHTSLLDNDKCLFETTEGCAFRFPLSLSTHSSQLFGDKSDSLTECCHLGKDNPGVLPSETTQKLRRKGGGIVRDKRHEDNINIVIILSQLAGQHLFQKHKDMEELKA